MTASTELHRAPLRSPECPFSSWCFHGMPLVVLVLLLSTCSDACIAPPRFESMIPKGKAKRLYYPGKKIEYECRPGYMPLVPPHSTTTICQPNNSWLPLKEACTRKSCSQLAEPLNGQILYVNGTSVFGSQAHYVCNEGHYLLGTEILHCKLTGNDVEWSDSPPQCEKILCRPPNQIPNGKYTDSHKDVFEYNELVTYSCNPSNGPDEYSLVGESSLVCSGQDIWSSDPPECKVVKCPYPVLENGRLVSGFGKKFYYKETVTFECLEGFYLEGISTLVCGDDSTWKPKMPNCIQGAKSSVLTTPPISNQTEHATPNVESSLEDSISLEDETDGALIAVIGFTVFLVATVVATCAYKYHHIRKRAENQHVS